MTCTMNFEGPTNVSLPPEQKKPVLATEKPKRRHTERLAVAAALGVLAAADASAGDVLELSLPEPTVLTRPEASKAGASARVARDAEGRASLPAARRDKAEGVKVATPVHDTLPEAKPAEENLETNPEAKPGRTVLFSEYQGGVVPSADPEVVQEQYTEKIRDLRAAKEARGGRDFHTTSEAEVALRVLKTERELRTGEVLGEVREQLKSLVSRVTEVTGANPEGSIQKAGDFLVSGCIASLDAALASRLKAWAIKSVMAENTQRGGEMGTAASVLAAAKNESLKFENGPLNARNMLLQYTLGSHSQSGSPNQWEVTVGVDPGQDTLRGKLEPAVGIAFRLRLP